MYSRIPYSEYVEGAAFEQASTHETVEIQYSFWVSQMQQTNNYLSTNKECCTQNICERTYTFYNTRQWKYGVGIKSNIQWYIPYRYTQFILLSLASFSSRQLDIISLDRAQHGSQTLQLTSWPTRTSGTSVKPCSYIRVHSSCWTAISDIAPMPCKMISFTSLLWQELF